MSPRSKTGSAPKKPTHRFVQTRLPAELYERVEKCADAEMISVAAYVRRLINTYVPGG